MFFFFKQKTADELRISYWSSDVCSSALGTVATHGIGPNIYKKLSYDAVADFEPVVQVVDQPYVLVAHPSKKISSVADLLKQAQQERTEEGRVGQECGSRSRSGV